MAVFKCDSCGYARDVPDKLIGKKAKCPKCRKGVEIVAIELVESSLPDEIVEELSDKSHADLPRDGEAVAIDDIEHDVDMYQVDEGACPNCGVSASGEECANCGAPLPESAEDDYTEDDVDVSDLAHDGPEVWDEDFGSKQEEAEGNLEDEKRDDRSWSLLQGSLPLNVFGGLVSGILAVFFAMALAILAASQQGVQQLLPIMMAAALTGMAVGAALFALQSRVPFALAGPETVLAAIVFLMAGGMVRDISQNYPPESLAPTVAMSIGLSALVSGFGVWLLGKLKLGEFIRYIPIQIIGGVIGGAGVFVLIGAFDWMGHLALDWDNLFLALKQCVLELDPAQCFYTMGPSVAFGLLLFLAMMKHKNSLFLLAMVITAAVAGYSVNMFGGGAELKSLGLGLPYIKEGAVTHALHLLKDGYGNVEWAAIKDNSLHIGALTVLMILTSMFRITNLETLLGREVELNNEYRSLGAVNMFSGLAGGMPVSVAYGRSVGNHQTGGRGPIAGIVAGLVCAAGLFYADMIIPYVPRFIPEGLVVYFGLDLIYIWLFKTKTAFTRRDDMWMLWMTFFATVFFGLLVGIGFGVIQALLVTVKRNSLGGVIRNVLSGANHRSNVDRAPAQQRTLKEFGDHIYIVRLQGFLFLGSMQLLLNQIRERLDDKDKLPVEFLLLDFRQVTGLASAAGIGFEKLRLLLDEYDLEIIITSAPLELENHFEESGLVGEGEGQFRAFFNLDYALEQCENSVLDAENMLHMK